MSEADLLQAVSDAMSDLGLTLTRQEPSAFERAFAKQILIRMTARLPAHESEETGPWWVAGSVLTRDDKQFTLEVHGEFTSPEERRRYMTSLCEVLNLTEARQAQLLDQAPYLGVRSPVPLPAAPDKLNRCSTLCG